MTTPDVREQLLDVISFTECANQGTTPDALINAYRDQVLAEAAEMLRAAPVAPNETDGMDKGADLLIAARTTKEA